MTVRMKHTHSKAASRKAHHRVASPVVSQVSGVAHKRHFADASGMYRGKHVVMSASAARAVEKQAVAKKHK